MRVPLSWLKDYVEITISAEELAERLTLAGLEVVAIEYIGVPQGQAPAGINVPPSDHLVWARDKIVLGAIYEVKPHPNADRLVLAMVDYGGPEIEQVVTGAPNLYPYKGVGPLDQPLWSPYALEGAEVYDGHAEGRQRMILKPKSLRGIPNRSMVCSAKELGLSEEHEGIMLLDKASLPEWAKPGTPLVDILGDVIFEIDLTPNVARAYSIIGVAREVAALTGQTVREPSYEYVATGDAVEKQVAIEIRNPQLNPRFTAMLIRDVDIKPSPQWMQRRLETVGVRSINNIVDVTNYVMFETGQPLHAFDYDVLLKRSGGKPPTIITRNAGQGEKLRTLDGMERTLDDQVILVCDTEGVLSLGGIMGGEESEIQPNTRSVLLEAANWNYINIRRTMFNQKMSSEAGLRFSRGIHPAQAERGVRRAIELMRELGGGTIAKGIIDEYPLKPPAVEVALPMFEVERIIGMKFMTEDVTDILRRLQFTVRVQMLLNGDVLHVEVPDHRVDIGTGIVGIADLCEEIARIYGYDRIPNTLIEDRLPPQENNESLTREEHVRDLLAEAGLRETVNYRLTTPEAEARLTPPEQSSSWQQAGYVTLANPISADKSAMRHTLLNGLLEDIAANQRHHERQRLYEIGSVFIPQAGQPLPDEPRHLALALTGPRDVPVWQDGVVKNPPLMDFFDLKGVLDVLTRGLRVGTLTYQPEEHHTFHPGRCAGLYLNGKRVGVAGELHPLVQQAYDLDYPVAAAELELDLLVADVPLVDKIAPIITQPAVYQDIALVIGEQTPSADVEQVIWKAGGDLLREVRLFDVYHGDPIPAGKKSLAYALTYQAEDRTLTDKEVAKVHQQIVRAAEHQLGATLRA